MNIANVQQLGVHEHCADMAVLSQAYEKVHGHFNVPNSRDKAAPHYALGVWLNGQRSMKRSFEAGKHNPGITQERIDRLTALGLEWSLRSSWGNRFAQLEDFRLEHGHCRVPAGGYTDSHGHPLHRWLSHQRAKVRAFDRGNVSGSKGITQEQVDLLCGIYEFDRPDH